MRFELVLDYAARHDLFRDLWDVVLFFVPQYFGYVAVAMALWFTVPVMRVVWQTTKDLRDIPDGEDRTNRDSAEEGTDDDDDDAQDG